jgi:hypothetical protein
MAEHKVMDDIDSFLSETFHDGKSTLCQNYSKYGRSQVVSQNVGCKDEEELYPCYSIYSSTTSIPCLSQIFKESPNPIVKDVDSMVKNLNKKVCAT